jgi:uncharacterized protein YndB with AHSA1/START domain
VKARTGVYASGMGVEVMTEIVIARPPDEVAAFAADPLNAPRWYVNITHARWVTEPVIRPGGRVAFEARFLGRALTYTYEIIEYEPARTLVMRTAEGPFPMETTYRWEPVAEGTRMLLGNRGEPTGFARFAVPVVAAAMRRANKADLARIKALLEGAGR